MHNTQQHRTGTRETTRGTLFRNKQTTNYNKTSHRDNSWNNTHLKTIKKQEKYEQLQSHNNITIHIKDNTHNQTVNMDMITNHHKQTTMGQYKDTQANNKQHKHQHTWHKSETHKETANVSHISTTIDKLTQHDNKEK